MIPHLQRCRGFAVDDYSFTLGRLGYGASSTFARLGLSSYRTRQFTSTAIFNHQIAFPIFSDFSIGNFILYVNIHLLVAD